MYRCMYICSCAYCAYYIGYGFVGNIWCLVIRENIMDVNVVVLNVGVNIAFLHLICTTVANETSPSLLTDVSEGWCLPPSVLLTGA